MLGNTPSVPELIDAPHCTLTVDLQFPDRAPVRSFCSYPVPPEHARSLREGMQLPCVFDPTNPKIFFVDWSAMPPPPPTPPARSNRWFRRSAR
jgi:hypothetical protein